MTQDMVLNKKYSKITVLLLLLLMAAGNAMAQGVVVGGNVYGGGNMADVKVNTEVNIGGGKVEGNVYGGGNLGDVGNIVKNTTNYNYKWTNETNPGDTYTYNNTGVCTVKISGGTVGVNGTTSSEKGNVFGGGKGVANTFWCEKGMVYKTDVSISKGTFYGNVYGGGQIGRVENNATVKIGPDTGNDIADIKGNVFGAGAGLETHGYSALLRGDVIVTVQGKAEVGGSVFGGGEIASVGRFTVVKGLPTKPLSGGSCVVTIKDDAKIGTGSTGGDVFGTCKGVEPAYDGSGENYKKFKSMLTFANCPDGNEGDTWDYYEPDHGYVWKYYKTEAEYLAFLKTLALASSPDVTISGNATIHGSVYGGGQRGITLGHVDVDIIGGTVYQDVYGGGALADTNAGNWDVNGYVVATALNEGEEITNLYIRTGDGTTANPYTYTKITDPGTTFVSGTYYRQEPTWADATQNSALFTTTVDLTGGYIKGDAYGGGLGQKTGFNGKTEDFPAVVWGDIAVTLNGTKFDLTYDNSGTNENPEQVVKSGRVFGCNNLLGSPQGNVTVTVNKTVEGNSGRSATADKTNENATYELAAVYGGGNLADYTARGKKAHVIINGCNDTSIQYVYGGGNAAAVPETDVDINAAYEIESVFGGGNGKDKFKNDTGWQPNLGANVNGNATTMIFGGTIHKAYGGSNESGTISGSVSINSQSSESCPLSLGKLYGAGNNADIEHDLIVVLGCMPGDEHKTDEVYGGANNANVKGNVELTITSGSFGKVFGGNDQSGAIFGHIILNIEESGCNPIKIDELYLGGNQASYSIYGYYQDGFKEVENTEGTETTDKPNYVPKSASDSDPTHVAVNFGDGTDNDHTKAPYADPVLNIISATHIGKVFGGGLGASAFIHGNPTVNINQAYPLQFESYNSGTGDTTYSVREEVISPIGEGGIYGGGNEAPVYGNTTVNIGNNTAVDMTVLVLDADRNPVNDANNKNLTQTISNVTVRGANIAGNVYGGGNLANVTGNTYVNICAVKNSTTYSSVTPGTAGVTIAGDVSSSGA